MNAPTPERSRGAIDARSPEQASPSSSAALSTLVPGLGQLVQRRYLAAAAHGATVVAYVATALALGSPRAALFAVAWNLVSAIDAYRFAHRD